MKAIVAVAVEVPDFERDGAAPMQTTCRMPGRGAPDALGCAFDTGGTAC